MISDEVWMKWAGIGPLNEVAPGNDWGSLAQLCIAQGAPRAWAVDLVVLDYLRKRDLRPLAALFLYGATPSPAVLRLIGVAMSGSTEDDQRPVDIIVKSRKGAAKAGRAKSPENAIRDYLLAMNYRNRKQETGNKHEVVVGDLAAELEGVSEAMIERAWSDWKGRSLWELVQGWSNSEIKKQLEPDPTLSTLSTRRTQVGARKPNQQKRLKKLARPQE
ncbi:MAG: hypothetical protein RIC87_15555 [Kiloniellales bacterium]